MPCLQHEIDTPYEKATFGMGCFWASDSLYGAMKGVLRTKVGYSGGSKIEPSYRNMGDHTEVIEIHFDPQVVCFESLLDAFWENHEYGLSTRIKRQYMSLILYHSEHQKIVSEKSLKLQRTKHTDELLTEIAAAGPFYPAEDYHQKYRLQQHPWLCEGLRISPDLLQTSQIAAKLNGYLVGLGDEHENEANLTKFGLTENMIEYVRKEWNANKGGSLYC